MVSRRHAVIEYRGSQFYLRDCNSSNGSLVNGDRVNERNLRDGDLVAIGTARLLFRDEDELEEAGAKVVPHPSAPRFQCPACHADHRKGDLFCRQCGGPLADDMPPRAVCASCGTAVVLPARFCNACGSLLPALPGALDPEGTNPGVGSLPVPPRAPEHPPASAGHGSTPGSRPPMPAGAPAAASSHPPMAANLQRHRPRPVPPRADTFRRELPSAAERTRIPSEPAGFGERLAAGLVDAGLCGAGQMLLVSPIFLYWWTRELPLSPQEVPFLPIALSLVLAVLAAFLGAVYYVHGWGVRGATPGKRLLHLVVEGEDGRFPIGLGDATIRLIGYFCSGIVLGIGFLMIAFQGRALHDRMAGTRVVRRERG